MRKAGYINVAPRFSPSDATSEKLSKKEVLLNYWDKFEIQSFGNAYGIKVMAKFGDVIH